MISPFEVPLIEQELVKEGLGVKEILSLCYLHVSLFRESLMSRELKGVPRGHPVDLLMRENELLMKLAEVLGFHARSLAKANGEELETVLNSMESLVKDLKKKVRSHHRKNQMLIFPYLERRGITAVLRAL